jgi:hypothetical protein
MSFCVIFALLLVGQVWFCNVISHSQLHGGSPTTSICILGREYLLIRLHHGSGQDIYIIHPLVRKIVEGDEQFSIPEFKRRTDRYCLCYARYPVSFSELSCILYRPVTFL